LSSRIYGESVTAVIPNTENATRDNEPAATIPPDATMLYSRREKLKPTP
jgi:hypothetical protein